MPKQFQPVKRIKPPVGFQEAARLLTNVVGMSDLTRSRRLKQAAYNIGCAIPWAEKALEASDSVDSAWLDRAVSQLKRAQCLLDELAFDAETNRRGWHLQLDAALQTFGDINLLYAHGAVTSVGVGADPVGSREDGRAGQGAQVGPLSDSR